MKCFVATALFMGCVALHQRLDAQTSMTLPQFNGLLAFSGRPGGVLFHNAFYGNATTRLVLLKAIAAKPDSARRFGLTETQKDSIAALQPIVADVSNDSPDELANSPDFFSFLTAAQLDRLTLLALHFDGLAALVHQSIAERVGLEKSTLADIRKIVAQKRESIVLPNFRVRFASNPSDQDKLRSMDFDSRLIALTNFEIFAAMDENEQKKIVAFWNAHSERELIEYIDGLIDLPEGLARLYSLVKQ